MERQENEQERARRGWLKPPHKLFARYYEVFVNMYVYVYICINNRNYLSFSSVL